MGYRSDVYMCIVGPKDQILTEIATLRLQGNHHMLAALDEWSVVAASHGEAAMVLGGLGTDWKWSDSYPDVAAHTEIFAHFEALCEPEASTLHGVFVCIGEDSDDIECRYFNDGYDLGNVQRAIYRAHDGTGTDLRPRLADSSKA